MSLAVISPSSVNVPIAHTFNHETSVAYVDGAGAPSGGIAVQGRWVAVANNYDSGGGTAMWSWMYSTDGSGSSWTFREQATATELGSPPSNSSYPVPSYSPSNGQAFTGLRGDVSIAAVTHNGACSDDWSNGGKRLVGVSLAVTANHTEPTDVVVLLSDDGGETWGNPQWVDTLPENGSQTDMPVVVSNPQAPCDTYVSWKSQYNTQNWGYLRKIHYDLASPPNFTGGTPIRIPKVTDDESVGEFHFGFGTMPTSACYSGQEGIFVVYANIASAYCPLNQQFDNGAVNWNVRIYDTGLIPPQNPWFGPFSVGSVSDFSSCVGSPLSAAYTNTSIPSIAVDPSTSDFVVAHTTQATQTSPVRLDVRHCVLVCTSGHGGGTPSLTTRPWTTGLTPNYAADEQWLPAVALNHADNGAARVAVYWYGTNDTADNQVALFASYRENWGTPYGPSQLTNGNFPVGGATTWAANGNVIDVWDYQTLGSSWLNHSFLAVWAGDRRSTVIPGWNGGFETGSFLAFGAPNGPADWGTSGAATSVTSADKKSGTYSALLGSLSATNGDSTISQQFTAPMGASTVSFWFKESCPDTNQYDWMAATLQDNTPPVPPPVVIYPAGPFNGSRCISDSVWQHSPSVAVIPGHRYTITLTSHDDNWAGPSPPADPTYTYFDDLTFDTGSYVSMMSNLSQ